MNLFTIQLICAEIKVAMFCQCNLSLFCHCFFTSDYSQIPGYVPITNAVPNWKKDMIIKKNEEKVKEYVVRIQGLCGKDPMFV